MIKYLGKCLLIKDMEEKVLIVGDLHICNDKEGINSIISGTIYKETISELDKIIKKAGELDKIILLGDLKDSFSNLTKENRQTIVNLFDYLERKAKDIIIIRGNHDNYIIELANKRRIRFFDHFVWKNYCFLHGDKDFDDLYDKKIDYWVMGHMHPAIKLKEGVKIEKYKCILVGKFKDKKVIILPSFNTFEIGIDVREIERELVWNFKINDFKVFIIGENLETLEFGLVRDIIS